MEVILTVLFMTSELKQEIIYSPVKHAHTKKKKKIY